MEIEAIVVVQKMSSIFCVHDLEAIVVAQIMKGQAEVAEEIAMPKHCI